MLVLPPKNIFQEWMLSMASFKVSGMINKLQGQPESYDRKYVHFIPG